MDREAYYISITFELQKKGQKFETITQFQKSSERCLVKIWDAVVTRLWSHKRTHNSNYTNTVYVKSERKELTYALIMKSSYITEK